VTPKIAVVGAGALGSHLVLLMRNFDAEVTVIDFDRVEAKNTQAQLHTKMGLGKNKAKALQSVMQSLWGCRILAFTSILAKDNVETLLDGVSLIVDCTDNIAARRCIQEFVYTYNDGATDCLHACLAADGNFARFVWTEDFVPDPEGEEGEATCVDGRDLPFFAWAGAFAAMIVQHFLNTGQKQSWQLTPTSLVRLT
jgi:molybdopterin/thiamine biosynthesis adenylyltransferase